MYFVARKDLRMSSGKLSAQGMHGLQYVLEDIDPKACTAAYEIWERGDVPDLEDHARWYVEWRRGDHTKITLAVHSLEELEALEEKLGHKAKVVVDRGRTEVEPNTKTGLCLRPMPRGEAAYWVGHLHPYRDKTG